MRLATADYREGYAGVADQVVQAYAPVGTAKFGYGRGVVVALEAKCRRDGELSMQELHDQLANLQVTAADKYDPARVIQEWRRICVELGSLGDVVIPVRKIHAFFRALPDEKYESLKTILLCDGSSSTFEDIAARGTSYHPMQIRENVAAKYERARGDSNAGSHERALDTVTHDGSRNFRRTNGRGQGRGRRRNGNTNNPARGNNNNGGYTSTNSNGNSFDSSNAGGKGGGRGKGRGNQARGRFGRGRSDGKNRHSRRNYCRNSTEHGWHDRPLRLSHQQTDKTQHAHANATHISSSEASTSRAWRTTSKNADLESFQLPLATTRNAYRAMIKYAKMERIRRCRKTMHSRQ